MKILILRFSSIGDIVLTSPVLRCIKTQYPEHELHYATKKQFAPLLENNPYLSQIHVLDGDIQALIKRLKAERFDLIIDLHKNIRTRLIRSSLRIKTLAFDKINWEKWLMVQFKLNILPYAHIVDRYLEAVSALKVVNDGKGLDYFIPANTQIDEFQVPVRYAVYALGAQHQTKKLPLRKQIELAQSEQLSLVLIGGKEDEQSGAALAEAVPQVINLCGRLSVHQSALLMQGAEKVYAHDTGMMHIAAALQKPILSIWGNTIPEFGMQPYYGHKPNPDSRILEVKDLPCRPCSKIGFDRCPKGHFNCMELIDFGAEGE